jgi:hypothetical protein
MVMLVNSDGLCATCDPVAQKRAVHAKELVVKAWLDAAGIAYESHDRTIERGACVLYRPDFRFDAGTHRVCLEVDEHQHQSYACECEQTRMVNIAHAEGGMPLIFIRYNPDKYKTRTKRAMDPSHHARKDELLGCLHHALNNLPSSFCEAHYLFYDGYGAPGDWARTTALALIPYEL